MNIKHFSVLFFISFASLAQATIASYYGKNETTYDVLTTTAPLDHSATGANKNWNFSGLSSTLTATHKNVTPTALEIGTYPGTTVTLNTIYNSQPPVSVQLFAKDKAGAGELSLTALTSNGLVITFNSSSKPLLGNFPMAYNTTINNPVSGTFTYNGTASGTFTGTLSSVTDSYGTLNLSDYGSGVYTGNVTRLTNDLNITLSVATSLIGTVTQRIYNYYESNVGSGNPILRQVTTNAKITLLGIDQTDTRVEKFKKLVLGTTNYNFENALTLKNPFTNSIELNNNQEPIYNASISIFDISGKNVYQSNEKKIESGLFEIPVQSLNKGLYLLNIKSDNGDFTKKIIKN